MACTNCKITSCPGGDACYGKKIALHIIINITIQRAAKIFQMPEDRLRETPRTQQEVAVRWAVVLALHVTMPERDMVDLVSIADCQDLTETDMVHVLRSLRDAAATCPRYARIIARLRGEVSSVVDLHPLEVVMTQHTQICARSGVSGQEEPSAGYQHARREAQEHSS